MKPGGARILRTALAAAALIIAVCASAAVAQPAPTASDVKAAYLLKLGAFVDWPSDTEAANAAAPVVLCISGRDAVTNAIARQISGAAVGDRPISLRRLQKISVADGCHIAYVAGSPEQSVGDGLRAVAAAPVLTITDADRGETRGMIHFAMQQKRVRFHIDAGAATRSGLSLSSKLLALALSVKA